MKTLFFFTSSYPYGFTELWKEVELQQFQHDFEKIYVIPFNNPKNNPAREVPPNAVVTNPVITDYSRFKKDAFSLFKSKYLFYYLKEFVTRKVFKKKYWLRVWFVSSVWTELIRKHAIINKLLKDPQFGKDSILYFFWARENAFVIPLLEIKKFRKIVVRFHGYDLYEERKMNDGYIPYRQPLLKCISDAVFVSQHGLSYMEQKYPGHKFASHLFRLGSLKRGVAVPSEDGIFKLYTCSSYAPVKRLDLLARALMYADTKIEWNHIGSGKGPDIEKVMRIVENFPSNVKFIDHGFIQPDNVLDKYNGTQIDLLINVSESEGVPVSIMEAISAGIPIMATNVGGTAEVVPTEVGILLEPEIEPVGLWHQIKKFIDLPLEKKIAMRVAARDFYEKEWNAVENAKKFSSFLSK
jgi:colanic acid/amylovoran biosynthesis glycosyltransferase